MSPHDALGPPPGRRDEWTLAAKRRRRVRVVLAAPHRVVRPPLPVGQQATVGERLVRDLVRTQFRMAATLGAVTVVLLAGLPALFLLVPEIADHTVFGVPVPWLILGVLAYPVLVGVGHLHNRLAERNERDFVTMLDN
ncbi:hypothetical protein LX15_004257 [Streptoalloteichus tenebrarius]|uniref:Integral membrane protein n=1 Tax=Streptoalloteichus tenebrarius (strain ATCC 17920 / DSM 40477 / JCM 4838 / CBS 697.72 / NBRC 16177 / NCIMB 11028 / NRRL B-12390 / A12253. 1 / ISP 5477) TaxID=1933 RepID=A0ABT1HYE0_STRSD|nr:hypothetical protein [Streptoalloteichus tenebrarius]MCP2260539.1 hypothetical protein [Streptoalloteichus tenebrarius]BFF01879.1 hypothetical protein GCM10020241_35540 [Streptoalloteichus tenebrarius]